jgi:hypothetical protein
LKNLNEPPAVAFQRIIVPRFGTYSRKSVSSTTVEGNVSCLMICLAMDESRTSPLGKSSPTLDDPLFLRERTRTE